MPPAEKPVSAGVHAQPNAFHRFMPTPEAQCERAFAIQSAALIGRLRHTGIQRVVLGLSGGSDLSMALLVCYQAFAQLGLDKEGILPFLCLAQAPQPPPNSAWKP